MRQHNANKLVFLIAGIISIAAAIAVFTGPLTAQAQAPWGQEPVPEPAPEPNELKVAFKVGTYRPQVAFEKHPLQKKLMQEYERFETAMGEAQQEGDQEKVRQVQQQFEQQRTQIVQQFHTDVQQALPEVAEEAGIKVIALEIAYTAEDVATQDLTEDLVKTFAEDGQEQTAEPQFQFPGE